MRANSGRQPGQSRGQGGGVGRGRILPGLRLSKLPGLILIGKMLT